MICYGGKEKSIVRLTKNKTIGFNILSSIILQGLAFLSGPIFSGSLGTNNYGIASVYLTWVQVASTVFSLQIGTIAIAKIYFPESEQSGYQSSVLSLATMVYFGFSVVTILVYVLLRDYIKAPISMIILGLMHGWGMYVVTFVNSKFTYEFKADKNCALSIVVSTVTIGVSIILINAQPTEINYWGRILGQSIPYFVIGCILVTYILVKGKKIIDTKYWKFTLPIAIPTVFHLLANMILHQSDKVMLQNMMDNSTAGIYALACTFSGVIQTLWNALNNSWVPFYYEYTKNNQIEEIKIHTKNYIELFSTITIGFILLSREVFHLYAKSTFWDGTDLIPLFGIGFYFVFLYSFPVNFEFYNKKTKTIALGTGLAAICNLALNYILIKKYGMIGAVIATAVSHGIQFFFHYLCAKRIKEIPFHYKILNFLPGLIAVIVSCLVYILLKDFWPIRWGIGAILGALQIRKIVMRKEIF